MENQAPSVTIVIPDGTVEARLPISIREIRNVFSRAEEELWLGIGFGDAGAVGLSVSATERKLREG